MIKIDKAVDVNSNNPNLEMLNLYADLQQRKREDSRINENDELEQATHRGLVIQC